MSVCVCVNMYHVSAQGINERMINVHYYYIHFHLKKRRLSVSTLSLSTCSHTARTHVRNEPWVARVWYNALGRHRVEEGARGPVAATVG